MAQIGLPPTDRDLAPLIRDRQVTRLINAWNDGEHSALDELIPLIMDELKAVARAQMARETPGHTLQPTALVHEAYLRLAGRRTVQIANRVQLFAILAETMRRILVDHARHKKTARLGGGVPPLSLSEICGVQTRVSVDLLALDDALKDLAAVAPRQHETVKLSYFAGLTYEEIAELLGVSRVTVKRDLKAARIWLLHELRRDGTAE